MPLLALVWLAFDLPEVVPASPPTPIVNGTDALPCQFPSTVAMLTSGQSQLSCSGTLIHPEVVLIAAHCMLLEIDGVAFGETSPDVGDPAFVVDIAECVGHPDYDLSTLVGPHDVGYCRLAEPITDIAPVPLLTACETDEIVAGQTVTIVGYGASWSDASTSEGTGVKRFVDQVIDSVDELGIGEVNMTGTDPTTPQSACFGDSGGSAFIRMADDTWRVFGAGSHLYWPDGSGNPGPDGNICGSGVAYGYASLVIDWLESDSGIDLTPCYDGDTFVGGSDCGSFPTDIHQAVGSWDDHCSGSVLAGGASTCMAVGESTGGSSGSDGGSEVSGGPAGSSGTTGASSDGGSESSGAAGSSGVAGSSEAGISSAGSTAAGETGLDGTEGSAGSESTGAAQTPADDSGCGCTSGRGTSSAPLAFGLLALLRRRRRGAPA